MKYRRPASSPAEEARRARFETFVDGYYFARHADLLQLEAETGLYEAEVAGWKEAHPGRPLTFKAYLIGSRGMPR